MSFHVETLFCLEAQNNHPALIIRRLCILAILIFHLVTTRGSEEFFKAVSKDTLNWD
jgi:hypothetical protein